jgi:hypothetical protein
MGGLDRWTGPERKGRMILRTKNSSKGFEVGHIFTVSIAIRMIREVEQGLKYSRRRETLASNLQALF